MRTHTILLTALAFCGGLLLHCDVGESNPNVLSVACDHEVMVKGEDIVSRVYAIAEDSRISPVSVQSVLFCAPECSDKDRKPVDCGCPERLDCPPPENVDGWAPWDGVECLPVGKWGVSEGKLVASCIDSFTDRAQFRWRQFQHIVVQFN